MTERDRPGARVHRLSARVLPPELPDHDDRDVVESAVIGALSRSWPRRAAVKKREADLDALFDPALDDYPDELLPFHDHPRYLALDEPQRARLRAWAWIAYNRNVIDIEQRVVNPGFGLILADTFGIGPSDEVLLGVLQATVDEQYHTLMHHNANAVTRRRRGWALPDTALPTCRTVREHDAALARAADPRAAALARFAYTTVAETSISAYLGLLTGSDRLQPVNRSTVAVHRRDELCHGSLTGELLTMLVDVVDDADRDDLLDALAAAVEAFTGGDLTTWEAILRYERIPGREVILADTAERAATEPVVQDCSAIRRLCADLGLGDDLDARWPYPRSS